MKKWFSVFVLAAILCIGAKKLENDYRKYLLPINNQEWVKAYGDSQESALYYTIAVLRNLDVQQNRVIEQLDVRVSTLERQIIGGIKDPNNKQ